MNVSDEFWLLVKSAETAWENTDGADELEPYLLAILEFAKKHSADREELVRCFSVLVKEDRGPIEILEFCMRELQWQEVKDATIQAMKEHADIRVLDALDRVLAVYEAKWDDADLYKYYS